MGLPADADDGGNPGSRADGGKLRLLSDSPRIISERGPHAPIHMEVMPTVDRTGLGLTLSMDDSPAYLTVDAVRDTGLVKVWNDTHGDQLKVAAGDRITSVNHISGDAAKMLQAIRDSKVGMLMH